MPSNSGNRRRQTKSGTHSKTHSTRRTSKERTDLDKTQRFRAEKNSATRKNVKEDGKTRVMKSIDDIPNKNKKKKHKKHPKLMLALKIFIILVLLICIAGAGIIAALFFGVFGNDFEITKEDLVISASNSKIVDVNGNVIADLSGDEKRKIVSLDQMAPYLPKAYIAIEDERFYEHDGVDLKRTFGAIVGKLFGKGSYGGSTITQQLVKNITKDDETSGMEGIMRKIREWAKAYQVERMISKDQILELYLNILYIGGEGNLHGVELGAEYYFNKTAKDLDLAECSFLAGINSQPNYYNPYKLYNENDTEEKRAERIKSKCLTVLGKMKELNMIENEDDYNAAVEKVKNGLPFQKAASNSGGVYSYHTDALIEQVINQVMEEKNCTREIAENYIYGSGLTIYSTVDTSIQSTMEETFGNAAKYQRTSNSGQKSQSGMVVLDYKTGYVLGVVGGIGTKTEARGLNRATQSYRQTGSSMKPLATVAPGLQEKVIQASTVYDDASTLFDNTYKPVNYNYFRGLINIREFIKTSQNIPAVKIMKELTPAKSIDYMRKMGMNNLYKNGESDKYSDENLPLSIGGLNHGVTVLDMATGYGCLANGGESITPTFYSKIEDSHGNVVMTPNQTRQRAISTQNAYITTSILQEPVKGGTASYCAISGIDVAAKTGTSENEKDRWLCGYTPYYSAACWYGYDNPEYVSYRGASTNPAGDLWDAVMTKIHQGKESARFTKPEGIVTANVCRATGCLAAEGCTDTYQEIFTSDNMPPRCEGHGSQEICKESGKLANEYCTDKEIQAYGLVVPKEKLNLWKPLGQTAKNAQKIEEVCDIHKKPEEPKEEPKKEEPKKEEKKEDENSTNTNSGNTNTNSGNTNTNTGNTNTGNNSGNNSGGNSGGGESGGNAGGNTGGGEKPKTP
ncbi:MAG: penicillin-binding protein [Clostridia bacterium]|nr:penicillin-binding protein [Clostridia bacterium]